MYFRVKERYHSLFGTFSSHYIFAVSVSTALINLTIALQPEVRHL